MTTVTNTVERQRIDAVRALLSQELRDIASDNATVDSTEGAVRAALRQLDALVLEPVVLKWLTATGRVWPCRQVPWKQLATVLDAPDRSPTTQVRLEKELAAVFGDRAPQRKSPLDRRSGSGYSVIAMWAAITEWHLDVGLPVPDASWRQHAYVGAILDLIPVIAGHPELAQPGSQPVAFVRSTGRQVPTLLQSHVAEIARHHHETTLRWATATRAIAAGS